MKGEIYFLQESDEGTVVGRLILTDYRIEQLDRIEGKLDKLLNLVGDKEQSKPRIQEGTFSSKSFNVLNSNR